MPLSVLQRAVAALLSDGDLAQPLWKFHPSYRPAVLSERRKRALLQHDPEPTGDPEFN